MSSTLRMPEVGETLAGKYRLEDKLGEGGMGVVFRAEHLKLARKVAIKMLLPDALGDAEMVTRLQREARAAGQLESRHVARVLDVDETPEGVPYIVMELLEGHDLEHELVTRGRLSLPEAAGWVLQACEAMVEAHARGIVHRDLKPSNLFLARVRGGERTLKILDFGISKLQDEANVKLTAADRPMGTPLYMSPEQVRSAAVAGSASDQWALAVILYELVTGTPPFAGATVSAVAASVVMDEPPLLSKYVADVPDAIQAAIQRALAKDPAHRFPDVASFAHAIAPFAPRASSMPPSVELLAATARTGADAGSYRARTGPVVETSTGTTTSANPPRRRLKTKEAVGLVAGAAALLAAGAGVVTWARGSPHSPATASPTAASTPLPSHVATTTPSTETRPPEAPLPSGSASTSLSPPPPSATRDVSTTRSPPRTLPAIRVTSPSAAASPPVVTPRPPPQPTTAVPDNPERL